MFELLNNAIYKVLDINVLINSVCNKDGGL